MGRVGAAGGKPAIDEVDGSGSERAADARRAMDGGDQVDERDQPASDEARGARESERRLSLAVALIEVAWLAAIVAAIVWVVFRAF